MNFEQLRDWKDHYRGIVAFHHSKLVELRTWFERIDKAENGNDPITIHPEEWELLREISKRELFKLPSEEIVAVDKLIGSGLIQLSLLKETKK